MSYSRNNILEHTLGTARYGEEFLCTHQCYRRIKERVKEFQENNSLYRFFNRRDGSLVVIWRSK